MGHDYDGDICTRCGWIRHDHEYETTTVEPDCTNQGYTRGVCKICGATYTTDIVDPLGHDYDNGFCSRCDYFDPEVHRHTFSQSAVDPDCTEQGYTVNTCYCGYSYNDSFVDPLGHNHIQGKCTRCGNINATDGLEYTLFDKDGSYYICSGLGTATQTDIVIAPEYNGKPVKEIGEDAFGGGNLTSVVMYDSIIRIGDWAFEGCSNLKEVTFGDGLLRIGVRAFDRCSSLKSLDLPETIFSLGFGSFGSCESLTSITVSEENKTYYSAGNCLIYKNSKWLILGCSNSVIPDDVTAIEEYAFEGCTGLTGVTIPDSVTYIGNYAFGRCTGLTSITIPGSIREVSYAVFGKCSNLKSVVILDGVTSIGGLAFSHCENLTSIKIPSSVTSIGKNAFEYCYKIENVTAPALVFSQITKSALKTVVITGGNAISNDMFTGCVNLTSVTLCDGITTIGSNAFYGCRNLTSINIPDSVTTIGDQAFLRCTSLTSVYLSLGVTSVGAYAFGGCEAATIYCEAESKPDGWSNSWNSYLNRTCPVEWNYKK